MPPAKKRKKQEDSTLATKSSMNDVTKLQELYMAKSWNKMIKHLKTNEGKEYAKCTNIKHRDGKTFQCFLHLVLHYGTPNYVICAIIQAYPDGARLRARREELPLCVMFSYISPWTPGRSSVVEALLCAYPEAVQSRDKDGRLPLHDACASLRRVPSEIVERLLSLYPEGAHQTAEYTMKFASSADYIRLNGWLPIHVACCTGANVDVINLLIKAYPQSLHKRTSNAKGYVTWYTYRGSYLKRYENEPKEDFENLTPFQWCFKTGLSDYTEYKDVPETDVSVAVFLLMNTYPNMSLVERDRFYLYSGSQYRAQNQTATTSCRRNASRTVKNKDVYHDKKFLLLHYALICGAPIDIIKTISEHKSFLFEKNMFGELPIHCALDNGNVLAAIHLIRYYDESLEEPSTFPLNEVDKEEQIPLYMAFTKCSPYDERRNHLLYLMYDSNRKKAGTLHKLSIGNQLLHCPLHIYLMKMIMTPDADPRQGCGGVVTICPLVVQNIILRCPTAAQVPLRCQQMRSGYQMLVAKNTDGVELCPFQVLCLLFSDMHMSNINVSGSHDGNKAFWDERDLIDTNRILMRQNFLEKGSKVDQDIVENDAVVIDVLFQMLQLYPAAISSD